MKALGAAASVCTLTAALLIVAGPVTAPAAASHAALQARRATPITPNGSWPVYHHDDGHTGLDPTQPKAITATAGWTSVTLDEAVYGEPLVYQGLVYVATLNNTIYALNQTDGTQVWATHLYAPETNPLAWQCGNVSPQGILGTPVIDPGSGRIYAATFASDHVYRLEGLNLTTGVHEYTSEITTGTTFDWTIQQERGALGVHNGYVYVPFGGRAGDCGPYHGWMFAVPIAGGTVLSYATPGVGAGFWNAGGVVIDDSTGKIFNTSGNGTGSGCNANAPVAPNPNGTPVYENDAVVRWSATLAHEDAFVPEDWQANWCSNDEDLGSASMVLISPSLAFQAGKWGNGFLINPQVLGGMDGQVYPADPARTSYTPVDVCLGNHHDANFGSYAYASPFVYLGCDGHGLVALQVNTGAPSFSGCDATCASPSWHVGTFSAGPPIVAGGAVWTVDTGGGGLYGFDAMTGAQIYHSAGFSSTHFTTPSEAGGQIFVGSGTVVRSFKMTPGCLGVSQSANPTSPYMVGGTIAITAAASGCPNASPQYEFWVLAPGASLYTDARPYSTSAVFSWSTVGLAPGTYRINVWARDAQSPGAYSNPYGTWDTYNASLYYTLTAGCPGVTQSASPPGGAMITTTVTVTANAP
ncbi:MAG TPA: PQQ-binding-like beta-propeller repeat protein, partial [Candidatus Dormibacteraeota bacterium]|nr:PQQ-binding-like beta-propeller repeat protein [Candidatus Dormibacteraeota bacterium]